MRLCHHSTILLLNVALNQYVQASDAQDTIVLFGTFDVTPNRTLVVQPPDVNPDTLPVPQDGNRQYIPTTKKAESAIENRHRVRNGLLIGLLVPFAFVLVVIAFLVIKTVKIRREKSISLPSWKIILSPTGRWPIEKGRPKQRPRIEHLRIPIRRRDAPTPVTRKDARWPRDHQSAPAELDASTLLGDTEPLDQFLRDVEAEPLPVNGSKPETKITPNRVVDRVQEMQFTPRPGAAELYGSFPKAGKAMSHIISPFITNTATKEPDKKK